MDWIKNENMISIIIPCYNNEATIIESIESVLSETSQNEYKWELILVDDGSLDNTMAIIEDYINKSSEKEHIQLIKQANRGAAAARNKGIKASHGEFIAFNDADDRWLPGKLRLQMNYLLEHENVVLIGGIFDRDNIESVKKVQNESIITIKDQILKNYFATQTVVLRKEILSKSGLFSENMKYAEEGYFFNNIVFRGKSILLKKKLAMPIIEKRRFGDSGLSGNLIEMEKGELFNIKSAYKFRYISFPLFIFAYCFSIAKFIRRVFISKILR